MPLYTKISTLPNIANLNDGDLFEVSIDNENLSYTSNNIKYSDVIKSITNSIINPTDSSLQVKDDGSIDLSEDTLIYNSDMITSIDEISGTGSSSFDVSGEIDITSFMIATKASFICLKSKLTLNTESATPTDCDNISVFLYFVADNESPLCNVIQNDTIKNITYYTETDSTILPIPTNSTKLKYIITISGLTNTSTKVKYKLNINGAFS